MHEETRRRLLRAAFLLLCLMPTVGVLGWALVRQLPVQTRRLEQQLQQQLGVVVRIGRLSHLRPGHLRLENVALLDLESRQPITKVSRIDASATNQGWRLAIPELTMPANSLAPLWQIVHQRLIRQDDLASRVAQLAVQRLELSHANGGLTLLDVNWARAPRPDVQRSQLFFALPDSPPSEGVRVGLQRDRSTVLPVTRLTIDTGSTSLPLSLLANVLGYDWPTKARVRGKLPVVWQSGRWQAEFVGQLSDLNLDDISPTWITHDLQGTATLNVSKCSFNSRGLQSIQGRLDIDQVTLPRALVQSFFKLNLLMPGPAYAAMSQVDPLVLPQLGVSFAMGEMGVVCRGAPDDAGLLVAAATEDGPVLLSDGHVRVNYLICALVPEDVKNVYQARARLMDSLPATLPRFQ